MRPQPYRGALARLLAAALLALFSTGAAAQMPLSGTLSVGRIPGVKAPEPRPLQEIAALRKQGQFAQALDKAEQFIASEPANSRALFAKSVLLSEMGRSAEAATVLERLIVDFPELPEPYNNLAVIQVQRGELDRARQTLESALRANSRYALARENLGDVYLRLASEAYRRVLDAEPNSAAARRKLQAVHDILTGPAR